VEFPPETSLSQANVVIEWQPANSEGSPVLGYFIEIFNPASSLWNVEETYCQNIEGTSCEVPMNWFTSQHSYQFNELLQVRVSAFNEKGTSEPSAVSSGLEFARVAPEQVPALNIRRGEFTQEHVLHIEWDPLTSA
jgi:hypothetical protein